MCESILMSVDLHLSSLKNNIKICQFSQSRDVLQLFHLQMETYKKCGKLFQMFIKLIDDLLTRQFSNNDDHIMSIINSNISILYGNLIILFSQSIKKRQIFNVSINKNTVPGYNVKCICRHRNVQHELSYFITSLRLQINRDTNYHMIKIIHNDNNNIPSNVILIGKRFTSESIIEILECYKESLIKAINNIKVLEMMYICSINTLNEVIKKN